MDFLHALVTYPFLQLGALTGLVASVACGVVGTYVVVRRITYIAAAIAHSVIGGIGVAYYLQGSLGMTWVDPIFGAIAAALIAAITIGLVSLYARQSEDTVISAIWAIGMAMGILLITQQRGYTADLMSYLFAGNILMVRTIDVWTIVVLDVLVVGIGVLFYKQLAAICFDEEFAKTRGVWVEAYYLLLLCLTALTVVLLVKIVGLVLVIALLSLPVAMAQHMTRKLWKVMVVAGVLCLLLTQAGLVVSFYGDLSAGVTTVLLAGALYLVTLGGVRVRQLVTVG
jgi:zinc transport system permease protein